MRLLDRKAENEKLLDFRAGVVAAVLANQNRGRAGRVIAPGDFFPSLRDPGEIHTLDDVPKGWRAISGAQARDWVAKFELRKQQMKR